MSVSVAPELDHAVREAAGRAGMSLSAWLTQAADAKLR
jgi:predicted HicB family RNase H-like nuclease